MKIGVKNLSVSMRIKNKGIELDVYDNADNFRGDLVITKTGLTWCPGKTRAKNGKKISWSQFIQSMEAM